MTTATLVSFLAIKAAMVLLFIKIYQNGAAQRINRQLKTLNQKVSK